MLSKKTFGERIFDSGNVGFMIILSIVTVYPLIYVLLASFSNPTFVMQNRGLLLYPQGFTFDAYKLVFMNPNILTAYFNTLIYVVAGTAINVFLTSLGAYALSRRDLMWKNMIMFLIVFTMFFEGGLIPMYILVGNLGMYACIIDNGYDKQFVVYVFGAHETSGKQAYQVWLRRDAEQFSAGTFRVDHRGIGVLAMPIASNTLDFDDVGITLEPDDHGDRPRGEFVLGTY